MATSAVKDEALPPTSITNDPPSTETQSPWTLETALHNLNIPNPAISPSTPIPFFHLLTRLKTTPRAGWVFMGIPNPESISDHMYRMALITMLAPASLRDRLDIHKCTRMALLHDVAEAVVGDITPRDGVGKAEKGRREGASMDWIMGRLLGGQGQRVVGEELRALWQEYEDDVTAEARFVHDVDKFELMCQMVEYERLQEGRRADLGEFCGVLKAVTTREVMEWCLEVLRERREFWGERYDGLKGVGAEVELVEKIKLLK